MSSVAVVIKFKILHKEAFEQRLEPEKISQRTGEEQTRTEITIYQRSRGGAAGRRAAVCLRFSGCGRMLKVQINSFSGAEPPRTPPIDVGPLL